MSAAVYSTLV